MSDDAGKSPANRAAVRAALIEGFDALPAAALVADNCAAAVLGIGTSTLWRWFKLDPDCPKPIRLSKRCTRVNVGDLRAYLQKKSVSAIGAELTKSLAKANSIAHAVDGGDS